MDMKHIKANAIAEGGLIAALSVLLLVLALYIPLFSIASIFIAGIPLAYLTVKHNTGIAFLAAFAALLVVCILTGNLASVLVLGVLNFLPGLVLGICFAKRVPFYQTLFLASAAAAVGILAEFLAINYAAGGQGIENMITSILQQIEQMLSGFAERMQAIDGAESVDLNAAVKGLVEVAETLIRTFIPSFIIIVSLCIGYITHMLSVFILRRVDRGYQVSYIPFSRLKAPKSMCYAAILMYFIVSFTASDDILTAALNNLVVILYFFIGVCGFSFVDAKLSQKVSNGYLRFGIYACVFLVGYFFMSLIGNILILIGLADGVMDFRHLKKRGEGHVDGE